MNGWKNVALIGAVAMSVSGCVSTIDPLAGASREVKVAYSRRASLTPSPVSTIEFKELGDTRRHAVMKQMITATWGGGCEVIAAIPRTYTPRGDSIWAVRCAGSSLRFDYSVFIPERRTTGAKVLQCFDGRPGQTICNLVGRQG